MLQDRDYVVAPVCILKRCLMSFVIFSLSGFLLEVLWFKICIWNPQEDKETAESRDTFKERYGEDPRREDLTIFVAKKDDPTDQIFVFFPDEVKVGVKTIKNLAERMRNQGVKRAIMVVQQNMTPFAKQCLNEMQPKYHIELVSLR